MSRGAAASAARVATSAPSRSPRASRTRPSTSHSTGPGARSSSRGQLGQRPAAARHREGDRPDGAPALGVARWKLAKQRGEGRRLRGRRRPGSPPAMRRRAARNASSSLAAAWPGRSRASSTSAAAAGWPARSSASARRSAISSRAGSARASSRSSAMVFSCAALSGVSPERARIASAASMRRRRADGWLFELQRVVVCRQRGGIVAGCGQRARTAGDRGHGLRREAHDLVERGDRRLRVTERGQQVRVRRERRVRGAIARRSRGALGACAKPIAQPRPTGGSGELDEAPREIVVVRAFEQRPLGAFEQCARIGAVNLPVRAGRERQRRRARAGPKRAPDAAHQKDSTAGAACRPGGPSGDAAAQKNRPPSPHHCERRGPSEDFEKLGARGYEKRQPKRLT